MSLFAHNAFEYAFYNICVYGRILKNEQEKKNIMKYC